MDAHLRYLERDGVTRAGDKGQAYSAFDDAADGKAFLERDRDDRHQLSASHSLRSRFIVAPEDAVEIDDLRGLPMSTCRNSSTSPMASASLTPSSAASSARGWPATR